MTDGMLSRLLCSSCLDPKIGGPGVHGFTDRDSFLDRSGHLPGERAPLAQPCDEYVHGACRGARPEGAGTGCAVMRGPARTPPWLGGAAQQRPPRGGTTHQDRSPGLRVQSASPEQLLAMKLAAGRARDQADIVALATMLQANPGASTTGTTSRPSSSTPRNEGPPSWTSSSRPSSPPASRGCPRSGPRPSWQTPATWTG